MLHTLPFWSYINCNARYRFFTTRPQTSRIKLETTPTSPRHVSKAEAANTRGYLGSDGRRKASLEDAAQSIQYDQDSSDSEDEDEDGEPWQFGWQVAERNLEWNDKLAAKLTQRIAASQLHCSAEEVEQRLNDILLVVPTLSERISTMKPEVIVKLCAQPEQVAERLVDLKAIFPTADVEQMAVKHTQLLAMPSLAHIASAASELRDFLPEGVQLDRLCQQYPSVLNVASFKDAVNEVKRLMPNLNLVTALNSNPEIIFSTQRASHMIPYDPVPCGSTHFGPSEDT